MIGMITLISTLFRNLNLFYSSVLGVAIRKGISGVLYKKILRFNQKSKAKATSGKLVAIISGELQLIERGMTAAASIITSPIIIVISTILLSFIFKEGVVVGFVACLLMILILYILSGFIQKFKYKEGYYSDKRLKTLSDVINGIRTIKAYAWELPFNKLINKFRSQMVKYRFKLEIVESFMWGIGLSSGYIMGMFIFIYHYHMDRKFNYEDSLAAIGI